jgi:hypothetical protein
MISTYAELKTAIYKWLIKDVSDPFFDSDMMDNIIFLAEYDLNRRLRVRQMRDSASLAITPADNTTALPAGFIEAYSIYLDSPVQEIQSASAGIFSRTGLYLRSGAPEYFYITGEDIIWGPVPDSNYTVTLDYYKKIPALSSSQTTNAVLTDFPDMYLYSCLKQAYIAAQDVEREATFEQRAAMLIVEANSKDKKAAIIKGSRGVARSII